MANPPLRCPACGYIHWHAAPVAHQAYLLVAQHGPLTAAQLAEHTGATPQAATRVLARLADEGLLVRLAPLPASSGQRGARARPYGIATGGPHLPTTPTPNPS